MSKKRNTKNNNKRQPKKLPISAKTLKLLVMSIAPLLPGYLILVFIYVLPTGLSYTLQYGILILWGYAAYSLFEKGDNKWRNMGVTLVFPAVFLVLLLIQELIAGRYWTNLFGYIPIYYYTSMLVPAYVATNFFVVVEETWVSYIVEFVMLGGVSLLGCWLKNRKIYRQENPDWDKKKKKGNGRLAKLAETRRIIKEQRRQDRRDFIDSVFHRNKKDKK